MSVPLNCSDTSRVCTSFLAYRAAANQSLALIQSMFDVSPLDVTMERIPEADGSQYLFIKKNCSCFSLEKQYLSSTTFTVREGNGSVDDMVRRAYQGLLAIEPNWKRKAYIGAVVSLRLLCGCSSSLWNYIMTYVVRDGDTVASLASRFGVSMADIENLNGMPDRDAITAGKVYYIPLMSGMVSGYRIVYLHYLFCFLIDRKFMLLFYMPSIPVLADSLYHITLMIDITSV